ncbi:MAG: AMP-binding protein [Paracoccus sp. (in: a-proteobacteria)]|uniref:AMP-binding protein n=1 Tax=Paracoccus sp. TaxID=267 RepID=UPI0039E27CBB
MSHAYHSLADELAAALPRYADRVALRDRARVLSYAELGAFVAAAAQRLASERAVAVYGVPGVLFGAAASACVILGKPFVHLDPAMPASVLGNILTELGIDLVLASQVPKPGQLPEGCRLLDAEELLGGNADPSLRAGTVQPQDAIYLVATSGTTGRPKCIPVTHDAALLSYHWRETLAPYEPGMKVGVYIFAIWEMFRPLRFGAEICFPTLEELLSPQGFTAFLADFGIQEMLFTPSFLEKILGPVDAAISATLPLERIILNGEVVSDALIAQIRAKLPQARLWNLYSICETHDICMSELTGPKTGPTGSQVGVTVGKAMPHLRAIVLDDHDQPCPPGIPGLLHFEGPRMLGPGYVDRPEETARRFRALVIDGQPMRLYDTGDQGCVAADGQITVLGRVAHMLKLRGHSVQTAELTQTMSGLMDVAKAIPWVVQTPGGDQALVLYFTADAAQMAGNADRWNVVPGQQRLPETLARALRAVLPAYCVPSYLVHLADIPIHEVSGKCDFKSLPPITLTALTEDDPDAPAVLRLAARILHCASAELDPDRSFHDHGGDSLMCVDLIEALEAGYGRPVDFEWALNLPLARLHALLSAPQSGANGLIVDGPGLLLTGATGFLGGHVLAAALAHLPADQVVYALVRPRNRDAQDRLADVIARFGLPANRVVALPGSIDAPHLGLPDEVYASLCKHVDRVIHCAATVNLAVDRAHMEAWSRKGIRAILDFCHQAAADLRFSSTSAVFPETGGPWHEGPTALFDDCSGYGAAKIAAETEIVASGIPAAILRLPSLYDLEAANPRDICENILTASSQMGRIPQGLCFPISDVRAAAALLVELPRPKGVSWLNLIADDPLVVDDGTRASLPPQDWLDRAALEEGMRRLIALDPLILRADARFQNTAAKAAWQQIKGTPFAQICDGGALLARRLDHQTVPALT